ncbi:CAP domain-containing protein [Flavobacterium cerinum]|uniref:CAP domain-containing protein n=1 Tax=Flavobacterium cerinum TaxID=2502784 RepID=A0ABY5IP22_9FLAO|nr:CAP domain-containing protein [Flavobacterium cerinum]UUC44499.1 CAP domain-containing protein [Flavobacterium cerinum]
MKLFRSTFLLMCFLMMTSCSTDSTEDTGTQYKVVNDFTYNQEELQIEQKINDYRISKGLKPLEVINHISYLSEGHDEYMISTKTVDHSYFSEREQNLKSTLGARKVGENIAYGYGTTAATFSAWLNSDMHRMNIEGDYTHFGIAVRKDVNGDMYITNIFIKK